MNPSRVINASFFWSRLADAIDLDDGSAESGDEIRRCYREWMAMSDLMPELTGAEMSAGVELSSRNSQVAWERIVELGL
jgi:hypothetical protein